MKPPTGHGNPGFARPDYGPDTYDLTCDVCGAGWCGPPDDPCGWCERSMARLIDDQRHALLHPPWLNGDHGPRYDQLSDDDKLVWNRTRGVSGEGSAQTWVERLHRAVQVGFITRAEAAHAIKRRPT